MPGQFITFEGGEGAGKSTQIKRLFEYLVAKNHKVITTREPGGTLPAEEIRTLLVNGDPGKWSASAEALLNSAARDSHLQDIIRPALNEGKIVLCDRFMDSTRAYQGFAGGSPMALIDALEHHIVGTTRPDLTLVFDLDPNIGLVRAGSRGAGVEDRYERKGLQFHNALRSAFLEIAKTDPARCVVVNAQGTPDEVWNIVLRIIQERGLG
jgi:dTMP kinase